jgi:hypothetical protein
MQIFIPNGWVRCIVPAGLMLAFTFAHAQPQTDTKKLLLADPANAEAHVEAIIYRSTFTGYRSLRDEPVATWKVSNDLTAKIGGWRVYAREAQQPEAPAKDHTDSQENPYGGQP